MGGRTVAQRSFHGEEKMYSKPEVKSFVACMTILKLALSVHLTIRFTNVRE